MDDLRELDLYTPGFIAFDATVRLGSFTAAAEELNVTQPTISYRIKTLEERLGITLFLRRGRATELTFEGRVVLGQVRDDVYAFGVCTSHQTGPQRSKHGDRTLLSFVRRALDSSSTRALSDRRTRNKNEDSHDGYGPGEIRDTVDLWFTRGTGSFPGRQSWRICRQVVTPVCAPRFDRPYRMTSRSRISHASI